MITLDYIDTLIRIGSHYPYVMAHRGHILIPTTHPDAEDVIAEVSAKLATAFGGYSRYDGTGGWVNDDGELIEEEHARLVATDSDTDKAEFTETFHIEALYVKDRLNEDAVLVEVEEVESQLI